MIHSDKTSPLRTVFIVPLALLALPACQAASEGLETGNDVVITRITAEDTRDLGGGDHLLVSTQQQGEALMFDPAQGDIAYEQIDLVCPNGQQMGMSDWLGQLGVTQELDVAALLSREFTLASSQSDAVAALIRPTPQTSAKQAGTEASLVPPDGDCCQDVCVDEDCYLCPDGVWICTCIEWRTVCDGGGDQLCPIRVAE